MRDVAMHGYFSLAKGTDAETGCVGPVAHNGETAPFRITIPSQAFGLQ